MSDYDPFNHEHRRLLAAAIVAKLNESGFIWENSDTYGRERIYAIPVRDTGMLVHVYTSIVGSEVRSHGEDAIRVCGVYRSGATTRGITRDKRVNRTGTIEGIVERMVERMREAYKNCNQAQRCKNCGAPKFLSKKNNLVCAAACWTKNNENI